MLSLKTSKALKDAGFEWEPQDGDFFAYTNSGGELRERWEIASTNIYVVSGQRMLVEDLGGRMVFFHGHLCVRDDSCYTDATACYCMNRNGYNPDLQVYNVSSWEKNLFIPRLDQLLFEIENRGYEWDLHTFDGYYEIQITKWSDGHNVDDLIIMHGVIEEVVAQALIWILNKH